MNLQACETMNFLTKRFIDLLEKLNLLLFYLQLNY